MTLSAPSFVPSAPRPSDRLGSLPDPGRKGWKCLQRNADICQERSSAQGLHDHPCCHPAHCLGLLLPAATALSALARRGASPEETCGAISGCCAVHHRPGSLPGGSSPLHLPAALCHSPASRSALPGVTGSAGAHSDGRPQCTWPLERCGRMWGTQHGPCVVAVGGRSRELQVAAGSAARGLLTQGGGGSGAVWRRFGGEPRRGSPNAAPCRAWDPGWQPAQPCPRPLGGRGCPCPPPSMAICTAAPLTSSRGVRRRSLKAVAKVSLFNLKTRAAMSPRGLTRLCRAGCCGSPLGFCPGSFQVPAPSQNRSQPNRPSQEAHFRASQPHPLP